MNKQELLQLEKLSTLTPSQIEKQQPEIFSKLGEKAGISLKNNVELKLRNLPQEIRTGISKVSFNVTDLGKSDVKKILANNILPGLTEEKKKEIGKSLDKLPNLGKIDDVFQPDIPVMINPLFHADLMKAKVFRLTDIVGIPEVVTNNAFEKNLTLGTLSNEKLEELVNDKVLTEDEAKNLGHVANLYALFDSSFELTEEVKSIDRIKTMEDLVKLGRTDWKKIVDESNVQLPAEITKDEYAEILYKKVENIFPAESLVYRVTKNNADDITGHLTKLKPLFDNNDSVFRATAFENLDAGIIDTAEKSKLEESYTVLNRINKLNPGLKLDGILDNKNLSNTDKAKELLVRIGLLDKLLKNNPGVNYLELNYTHDSQDVNALNFQGIGADEKAMVLNSVKAQQRVFSFTNDVEDTESILAAGFHSAWQISAVTLDQFAAQTRIDPALAEKYFENANTAIIRTASVMGSFMDIRTGSFDWLAVGNTGPSVKDYLRSIPGYQDFFGALSFCECDHCQSIYSPAAYFVDMMQFLDKYIVQKHFIGVKANNVLNLKVRRPDLWNLQLTCENTNTLVPYLDIINEILETFIAKSRGFAGDFNNRNAIEEFVYKTELALEKPGWKGHVHSFTQPFLLPLEAVSTYLSHFEKSREQTAVLLKKTEQEISIARLGISEKEFELITVPDNAPALVERVYGIHFTVSAGKINPFDAQLLLKPMGVTRKELGKIVTTRFVTNKGVDNIIVHGEKLNTSSVQNDIERVNGLTYDVLEKMHRFVRLWRKTIWSVEELDMILGCLEIATIATGIIPSAVATIGTLLQIQEKLKVNANELCGLLFTIPAISVKENQKSLLDYLFNQEDIVATDGLYPKDTIRFIHPSLLIDKSTASAEFLSGRLMSGLNRSDEEVLLLIQQLARPLGIVNISSTTESERGFNLTLSNLSILYRHSKLAAMLNLSVRQLFQIIKLIPLIPGGFLENISHVNALLDFHLWWKVASFSLDELHYIIKSPEISSPENFKTKEDITANIISGVTVKALQFAQTVFAYFDDINEEQSKSIIAANSAVIELSADGSNYWLKPAFDPGVAIIIPAGITRSEIELREILAKYHPQYLLPFQLSGQLGISESAVAILASVLGINLNDDAYTLELQGKTSPAAITSMVEKLLPLSILFKDRKYDAEILQYILNNLPFFDITNPGTININNIQKLRLFSNYLNKNEKGISNIVQLREILNAFTPVDQLKKADQEKLAALLKTTPGTLTSIYPVAGNFINAVEALDNLNKYVAFCNYVGIGGDTLSKIVSTQYNELTGAANAILAAFRSKYKTEAERKEKLGKYQDKLRAGKRTVLTDYLIHSGFPQFENEDDLFHYFLIDTELGGCARTSRLVAATMSLQLYIHRIRLNLEQDAQDPGTPGRVYVQADDIPADEWEWRKNYRVWEANRKVFLYPENYIEPELRDDKTPLFEELESELLQREINQETVLDAYGKYMRGFDEVAHLKIAGSFQEYFNKDTADETDVLHLFGVTTDEPPLYYYRRIENIYSSEKHDNRGIIYGPWQKINVQIPVRKVAPVIFNGRLHIFWVNVTTLANTVFHDNQSVFTGYSHKMSIEFTTLKLDSTWTTPQKLKLKDSYPFYGNGVIQDPLAEEAEIATYYDDLGSLFTPWPFNNIDWSSLSQRLQGDYAALKTPRYDIVMHAEAVDEYTLKGFLWDQVYPSVVGGKLVLTGAGYQMRSELDFYNLEVNGNGSRSAGGRESLTINDLTPVKMLVRQSNTLYRGNGGAGSTFDNYPYASLLVNAIKVDTMLQRHWDQSVLDSSFNNIEQEPIAQLRDGDSVTIINGAYTDAIIDSKGDQFILLGSSEDGNDFLIKRIGTTLSETLTRTLFTSGVDTMLSITTQKALKEAPIPISITAGKIQNLVVRDKIDFKGACGNYYREIFFHIPFLIANCLNSQGKYADAQKWYHYIFNPCADEVIDFSAPGLTVEQKKKMELDRNWQYIEFRNLDTQKLRDQLNDKQAIEVYKKDPFNPHAIARLRLSAYQKSIVMKYIDNLLDWGDQLFTQDTMESINEATLLYIIAKEILGQRPAELGSCGEGDVNPKTYESIQPFLDKGSDFLAELEQYTIEIKPAKTGRKDRNKYAKDNTILEAKSKKASKETKYSKDSSYTYTGAGRSMTEKKQVREYEHQRSTANRPAKEVDDRVTGAFAKGVTKGSDWKKNSDHVKDKHKLPSFGISIIKHISPVFCIPGNTNLLDYYNRVDDRLFKIHNCMNILGQRRQLALFSPEIDPMLLVRARAAGISLDDILNSINGNLPPYRFTYILEKAKAFTSLVQSFGASLLSAIEKKNNEELSMLRMTQLHNILQMSSKSRKLEIDSANEGINVINDKIESLNYQVAYYEGLIAEGRNEWEIAQSIGRHTSSAISGVTLPLWTLTGVFGLIPQIGSPFAMKYGGSEMSAGQKGFARAVNGLAALSEAVAASSGLEAGFDRRLEGWKHQKKILNNELKQTNKNLKATELRRDILIDAERIHQKNIEHNKDIMDFYEEKFSSLGLYTWLSATMQRLFKESFNNAFAIAKLAEQAYRFEREDDTIFIDGNYFDSSRGGLLAGERLSMALQAMERRYLETNYRKNEIDQAFSLTQLNPAALLELKQESASCEFSIPEIFFDLFYPGQYRRKIQSVRLTIPTVTGPYTNVSATLSLTGSKLRMTPVLGTAGLSEVPKSRTTIIATSTAQNDAGVFQLNFRDERYMPFEGAGAISSWKLALPKNFRQFDYNTINDVIIHISYTAEYDELFREKIEEQNDGIEGTVINILKNNSMARTFSLRQEFSTDFHRITSQPLDQPVSIKLQNKHFPLFMNNKVFAITKAKLVLVTKPSQTVSGVNITINGVAQNDFERDPELGNLMTKNLGNLFNTGMIKEHILSVNASGDLAPDPVIPPVGQPAAIDTAKLEDIIIYVEYKIA